jgi:hypothetical protein
LGVIGVYPAASEFHAVNGQMVDQSGVPVPEGSLKLLDAAGSLNFDDMAPCFFFQTIPVPPTFFKRYGFVLKGPNASDGGAILNECAGFLVTGHSSPNFLAFNCISTMSNGGTPFLPEKIIFTTPVSGVSLKVGSGGIGDVGQSVTFTAKTALGKIVDTETVVLASAMTTVNLTSVRSNIKKVVVTLSAGSTACSFVIDDITSTP